MRPVIKDVGNLTDSATAICLSQIRPFQEFLLINGTSVVDGVAVLGAPQIVTLTSTSNLSALTFIVSGVDADGNFTSESLAGPNSASVKSTKYFKTVSSITLNGGFGAAVTVGALKADGATSGIVPLNWRAPFFNDTFEVSFLDSADATAALEVAYQDPNDLTEYPLTWYPLSSFGTATANKEVNVKEVTAAVRMNVTNYVEGTVRLTVLSSGYALGG